MFTVCFVALWEQVSLRSVSISINHNVVRGEPVTKKTAARESESNMASYNTNEFRSGLRIIIDADPCIIVENEFVKPGKGQAFNRVKIKNLKTGRTVEKTFKSGESVEAADVVDTEMQFLYADGEFWHFMVPDTFEQYAADANAVADAKAWLSEQDMCQVTLWNNAPLLVAPPNFVELVRAFVAIPRRAASNRRRCPPAPSFGCRSSWSRGRRCALIRGPGNTYRGSNRTVTKTRVNESRSPRASPRNCGTVLRDPAGPRR